MDDIFGGGGGGGGGGKTTTETQFDPTIQALNALRFSMAQQVASGGIPSAMGGYLDKVVIPSTINAMTAAGLGRSGAIGEAVAQATLSQGTDFLKALLTGIPSEQAAKTSESYSPGVFDWLGLIAKTAGAFA